MCSRLCASSYFRSRGCSRSTAPGVSRGRCFKARATETSSSCSRGVGAAHLESVWMAAIGGCSRGRQHASRRAGVLRALHMLACAVLPAPISQSHGRLRRVWKPLGQSPGRGRNVASAMLSHFAASAPAKLSVSGTISWAAAW
ncbi:hypothetical protein BD289DRAFT_13211 [Coniella lustricola]|uniref:Uncharacterized protein n=1 Tax=Coniella lustricola TaxID=2025994 RepID=A0A2T3A436_9PEZI|nr:hypothetical protein BD289DRAFT_13211 [Coniella lustricola]